MKKILAIIAALLLGAFCASAQLNIGSTSDGVQKLATLSPEWNWLYYSGGHYMLVTKTTNQFDDWIWLDLGPTKEDVIKTLSDLVALLEGGKKGQQTVIESRGKEYTLIHGKALGVLLFNVSAPSHAGLGNITIQALRKASTFLAKE